MATCAEVIQDILQAYDWASDSNYTDTNIIKNIGIVGIDKLDRISENKYIELENLAEKYDFAGGSESVIATYSQCNLTLSEVSTTLRDNLFKAIKTCFQESSYSIIYDNVKQEDNIQPYSTKMRVKLLNGIS